MFIFALVTSDAPAFAQCHCHVTHLPIVSAWFPCSATSPSPLPRPTRSQEVQSSRLVGKQALPHAPNGLKQLTSNCRHSDVFGAGTESAGLVLKFFFLFVLLSDLKFEEMYSRCVFFWGIPAIVAACLETMLRMIIITTVIITNCLSVVIIIKNTSNCSSVVGTTAVYVS